MKHTLVLALWLPSVPVNKSGQLYVKSVSNFFYIQTHFVCKWEILRLNTDLVYQFLSKSWSGIQTHQSFEIPYKKLHKNVMFLWWRMVSPDIALQWIALPVRYAVNLFFFFFRVYVFLHMVKLTAPKIRAKCARAVPYVHAALGLEVAAQCISLLWF